MERGLSLAQTLLEPNTGKGIILCMSPANERPRYNVTSSLIGWAYI